MYKENKLRGKIAERGLSARKLARLIGRNECSFSSKMCGTRKWSVKDITDISKALELTSDDIMAIFFADEVTQM